MILVDVNILINAVHTGSPHHVGVKAWLDAAILQGIELGFPWLVLVGFVRITTNPKITRQPFTLEDAFSQIDAWLALPNARMVNPTLQHLRHFEDQCRRANATANLVTDAHLAALAVEHQCELASTDGDFAKFANVKWVNPLVP